MLQYGPSMALELRRSAFRLDETHNFLKNERGASVICTFASLAPHGGARRSTQKLKKKRKKSAFSGIDVRFA